MRCYKLLLDFFSLLLQSLLLLLQHMRDYTLLRMLLTHLLFIIMLRESQIEHVLASDQTALRVELNSFPVSIAANEQSTLDHQPSSPLLDSQTFSTNQQDPLKKKIEKTRGEDDK